MAGRPREPDRFNVLVTDLSMPRIAGTELATIVHAIRPDIPVVLMTGNVLPITDDHLRHAGICEVIQKPFRLNELAAVLQRATTRPSAEATADARRCASHDAT